MSPSPRTTLRFGLVVALVAVAAACGGGQAAQPDDYGEPNSEGEGYFGNFMYGCTGVQPTDGKYVDTTLGSQQFCRCVYDGLKETVPFDEAKRFDEAQAKSEPGEISVPNNIEKVQQDCGTQ